jgi:hypothetical protein
MIRDRGTITVAAVGAQGAARRTAATVLAGCLLLLAGCARTTAKLPDDLAAALEQEGIAHRLDNAEFRRTRAIGTDRQTWDDLVASIVVTRARVLIHDSGDPLLEITPRSTGAYSVRRDGGRLSIRAGSGASVRSWSFHPPDDPEGWAEDIRAVIRGSAGKGGGRS